MTSSSHAAQRYFDGNNSAHNFERKDSEPATARDAAATREQRMEMYILYLVSLLLWGVSRELLTMLS